jgi:predicted HAD superfamily hydrolase
LSDITEWTNKKSGKNDIRSGRIAMGIQKLIVDTHEQRRMKLTKRKVKIKISKKNLTVTNRP